MRANTNRTTQIGHTQPSVVRPEKAHPGVSRPPEKPVRFAASGGLTTSFTYDSDARVTRITNPDTTHKDFTYNSADQMVTSTDELGRDTRLDHTSSKARAFCGRGYSRFDDSSRIAPSSSAVASENARMIVLRRERLSAVLALATPLSTRRSASPKRAPTRADGRWWPQTCVLNSRVYASGNYWTTTGGEDHAVPDSDEGARRGKRRGVGDTRGRSQSSGAAASGAGEALQSEENHIRHGELCGFRRHAERAHARCACAVARSR